MSDALRRILRDLDMPDLVRALAEDLSGADLTTLLLEVTRRRAGAAAPADLLERYRSDRFVGPGPDFAALRAVEDALIGAVPDGVDWVTLAPVVPLATHSAMGYVDQNNLVSTVRNTEVAADPTNGLALEAALRRSRLMAVDPKSAEVVRLAGLQRILRAQRFEGPMSFAHFSILGLVTAGRDEGSAGFESRTVAEHLHTYVTGLRNLGAERVRVALTRWNPHVALAEFEEVEVGEDQNRQQGYYRDVAFKVFVTFDGHEFEVGDGGGVDWTQRLCHSAKERMVVSGLGLDRLAIAGASRSG